MNDIVKKDLEIKKIEMTKEEAIKFYEEYYNQKTKKKMKYHYTFVRNIITIFMV